MIKIKGYSHYFFNPKDCEIYSIKNNTIKKLNPLKNRGSKIIYSFYCNGIRNYISKFEILKLCVSSIEGEKCS